MYINMVIIDLLYWKFFGGSGPQLCQWKFTMLRKNVKISIFNKSYNLILKCQKTVFFAKNPSVPRIKYSQFKY